VNRLQNAGQIAIHIAVPKTKHKKTSISEIFVALCIT